MLMKRKIIVAFLLFFIVSGVLLLDSQCSRKKEQTYAGLETETGISVPDGKYFRIMKDVSREGSRHSYRSLEGSNGKRLLRVEITAGLAAEEADLLVSERLQMIHSLYSNVPSPYPGVVTNTVAVAENLLPIRRMIKFAGGEQPLYILSGNSRYTYGAMSEELVAFRSGLFFFYSSTNGNLYRFDYFVPSNDYVEKEMVGFFEKLVMSKNGPIVSGETAVKTLLSSASESEHEKASSPSIKRPGYNLILIAFEPLGANHLSSYGYGKETTPNLDAFGREAVLFENAVSPSSWSLPVFMSWFTSLYPSQHKVVNKYKNKENKTADILTSLPDLSPGTLTMTQIFRDKGYRAAAFTGGASLAKGFGFGAGFEVYYDEIRLAGFDRTMPLAFDWLKEHRDEKLFLFVQGYDVHGRFPLKREFLGRFMDRPYKGPAGATEDEYWALRDRNLADGGLTMSPEDANLWKAVYDAKIHAADQRFGEFINRLRELGLLDNSIIVVSSGSGNEYFEHGRIDHGHSLYEELIHVPLLVRIPGQEHRRVADLVRTLDIMPTVFDILDMQVETQVSRQMRGVSLVPLMTGGNIHLDGVSETDYLLHTFKRSIKTYDGWKLIVTLESEKRELYNLNHDPDEQNNLVQEKGRMAYELEQKLFGYLSQ